jgi:hypothetical protein
MLNIPYAPHPDNDGAAHGNVVASNSVIAVPFSITGARIRRSGHFPS